jgi:heme exporter protein B
MSAFLALLRRDLRLGLRQGVDALVVVLFFLVAGAIFPFAVGPEPERLKSISGGVALAMAALAALLSLDRLYQSDHEDGSLDQILLSPLPLELVTVAKSLSHWLLTGLPLLLAAPVLAMMLKLPPEGHIPLLLSLALSTPILSLLGGLGAALTLGARRGGVLLTFLVLPLYVPALILGAAGLDASLTGAGGTAHWLILGGLDVAALALCPWATAAALREVTPSEQPDHFFANWEICNDLLHQRHSGVLSVTERCRKPESPWIPPFESAYLDVVQRLMGH